jgi:arylsulfatase A-like enzyme
MTVVPTTLASHTSLMTGKYPHTHGTPRNGFMVHGDNEMLAEVLDDAGFHTAGFAGSFALDTRFDFPQGFEHFDETFSRMAGTEDRVQSERPAEVVTQAVVDWLDETELPDHLFLFVHYFDPHAPYEAPPPFSTMYDKHDRTGWPTWAEMHEQGLFETRTVYGEWAAAQYAAEISYMDHHVGVLLDQLGERGILDEALLVVTSDHGETFWEHREPFDHGWSTYQTTMRSVGLVRLPGAKHAGTRVGGLAANIDILPTVLSYLGIRVPRGIDGETIVLDPPPAVPLERVRFGEATKPWEQVETDPRWTNMTKSRCIRSGRYKFVQVPYVNHEGLYDLQRDPDEQVNLLIGGTAEDRAVADRLRPRLESWADSARPLPSHFEANLRLETIERLKALGYLGDD